MPLNNPASTRGFASMDPARQREIASAGGKAAHASGNAHQFDSREAREAGLKSHAASSQNSAARDRGSVRPGLRVAGGTQGGNGEQPAAARGAKDDPLR